MTAVASTPIDALRREHANMRSVLALVAHQLDRLESQGSADYVLLANALYYMRKFPGHVHHPKEDLIFDKLEAADPSWKVEVEKLRAQHREIYTLENELIEAALDCPRPLTEAASRLLERGRRYLQVQREHSEIEERLLFPQALAVLKARDWTEISGKIKEVNDPLFGIHGGDRYRLLYEHLMRESSAV
ncbi:MAG TPA: hemerythrin domain-containing protein [Gammaproteobacteria bacterium]|nr:hemerythrin domain-containing protein [Gammaproteobacteria bacterium]